MIQILKIGDSPKVKWLNLECEDCRSLLKSTVSEVKKERSEYYESWRLFYRDWEHVVDKFKLKLNLSSDGFLDYLWVDYEYVKCPVCKTKIIIKATLHSVEY